MPSQQLELKSDITNLFKDLESIAKDTKVHAPHVPKIEQADITELFSGLNEAHEEAKIEVEKKIALLRKTEAEIEKLKVSREDSASVVNEVQGGLYEVNYLIARTEQSIEHLREVQTLLNHYLKKGFQTNQILHF